MSDIDFKYIHYANSAAGLRFLKNNSNIIRLGIILYGLSPNNGFNIPREIFPILTWKSVITMVKKIEKGSTIGYVRTFKAHKDMKIATISTGYADGYSRKLSNKGYVLIKGKKAKIVGNICMDQFMVDVTDFNESLYIGDEVILIGKSGKEIIFANDIANIVGTIGYEILCGISKRVPRIYIILIICERKKKMLYKSYNRKRIK